LRLIALLFAFAAAQALAHNPSDSYLGLVVDGPSIEGQWDIALRDLEVVVGLDANGNGEISWGEVRASHAAIASYALARLTLRSGASACPARVTGLLVDEHGDGTFAVLRFVATCPDSVTKLDVDYTLLFDIDPQHRGLLRLEHAGATRTAIFSPERSRQSFELAQPSRWQQFLDYGREGVWHIWIGFDHILFLLSLLLPAVLRRTNGRWEPVEAFSPAFWNVFGIVTAFTVAHSITLSLATLGAVALPSRLVEPAIALSVVLAALNNLRPVFYARRWVVAFLFGLVHGLGFANVLKELGLPQGALALALVGFNLGVEAGQLVIVGAFLPVAFLLRGTAFYRQVVFFGGSALIVLVAGIWVVERSLDVQLAIFAAATRPTVGSYDNMRDMLVIASAVRTAKSSFRGSPPAEKENARLAFARWALKPSRVDPRDGGGSIAEKHSARVNQGPDCTLTRGLRAALFRRLNDLQCRRRASPHCSLVNLVRSGRKQPQPAPAGAGGQARH